MESKRTRFDDYLSKVDDDHLSRDKSDIDDQSGEDENGLDVTYIDEEDQPATYDGVEEDAYDDVDDVISAKALQRNLSLTFEKHIKKDGKPVAKDARNGVKDKIKAFEQKKTIIPKSHNNHVQKVRFDNNSSYSRPPTGPVPTKVEQESKNNQSCRSRLKVYLRIRPPSVAKEIVGNNENAIDNTVEVLPPTSESRNDVSTTIRTYPPIESNTSKAVRGHQHNPDLISGDGVNGAVSVKGVKEFNFNQVFSVGSSQVEVFNEVAIPLVDGLFPNDTTRLVGDKLVGKSALLFSYGITNAGKTFTIMGEDEERSKPNATCSLQENHGVIPRAIDRMLKKVKAFENNDVKYRLHLSYLEIYNEQLFDLLPRNQKNGSTKNINYGQRAFPIEQTSLRIRESRSGQIFVRGLAKHQITSLAQGLDLVAKAKSRRHTSSNNINKDSSRSHSICQFEIVATPAAMNDAENESMENSSTTGYNTDDDSSVQSLLVKKRSVTFWIVDLAGSERAKRTGTFNRSTRQKEAALINSSLMKLMRCLQTLKNNQSSNNSSSVVPFRESKLTHLFMDHLTGAAASRTSMIVNINPSIADFDETQHVLSYATVAKSIRISEKDYNRKRQAIQMSEKSKRDKDATKSPPRKIAKIVKKLSPRAALAKMREQQKKNAMLKRKHEESASSDDKPENVKKQSSSKMWVGRNKEMEKELQMLKISLDEVTKKMTKYQSEAVTLRDKLVRCESEIRKEIYEETEFYHKCIHEQHNEIVKRLKQQIAAASQTPSKSAIKVQRDKADAMIDELMDKVDECEEEMTRMEEAHQEQITKLGTEHSNKLAKKDEEIVILKSTMQEAEQRYKSEIVKLNARLSESLSTIQELEREIYGPEDESEEFDSVSSDEAVANTTYEKENLHSGSKQVDPSPRLRRLPRRRCSEVACGNISPKTTNMSSSKKKQRKGLTSMRSPFKQKNNRDFEDSQQDNQKKLTKGEKYTPSKDLIYPSVEVEFDEATGEYRRPRGRGPSGRIWDKKRGAWRSVGV